VHDTRFFGLQGLRLRLSGKDPGKEKNAIQVIQPKRVDWKMGFPLKRYSHTGRQFL